MKIRTKIARNYFLKKAIALKVHLLDSTYLNFRNGHDLKILYCRQIPNSNSSKVKHAMGDVIKKCDASELELDEIETVSSH